MVDGATQDGSTDERQQNATERTGPGWPRRTVLSALTWLLILSPALVYLVRLPDFGRLQYNDYYTILNQVTSGDHFSTDPRDWLLLKSNEHTVTLPALAYAVNAVLTNGDNRGLSAFTLILQAIIVAVLITLLPSAIRSIWWLRIIAGFGFAMFVFTQVGAHSVVLGFSGTIWILANVFAVGAVALTAHRAGEGGLRLVVPVVSLGLLGALSYTTNLSLWPALLIGGLILRVRWRAMVWIAAAAAVVFTLYLATYQTPAWHPEPNLTDSSSLLRYGAIYMGSLFSTDPNVEAAMGLIGLTLSFLAAGILGTGHDSALRTQLAPWWMLQLYALGNCVGTAVGRSGFGVEQAASYRYASLPALFWISLFAIVATTVWRYRPPGLVARTAAIAGLVALVAVPSWAMFRKGMPVLEDHLRRAALLPVAEMALRAGLNDDRVISTFLPWPVHYHVAQPFLQATGHVPYDRPLDPLLGKALDPGTLCPAMTPLVDGGLERIEPFSSRVVQVFGWALLPDSATGEVYLVDDEMTVIGKAFTGFERPALVPALGSRARQAGWRGLVLARDTTSMRAFARLSGEGCLAPLAGTPEP